MQYIKYITLVCVAGSLALSSSLQAAQNEVETAPDSIVQSLYTGNADMFVNAKGGGKGTGPRDGSGQRHGGGGGGPRDGSGGGQGGPRDGSGGRC